MSLSIKKKYFKETFLFSFLFILNIAFKEIFRVSEEENTIFLSFLFWFLLVFTILIIKEKYRDLYIYFFIFFLFLFMQSLSSDNISYGIQKSILGLVTPLFCFMLFTRIKWHLGNLNKYFIFIIFIITVIGILYKLKYGFFQRSISFGLLGSITFGWLSGMAFLAAYLEHKKSKIDYFLIVYFFLMILWSGSKGPLLSVSIIALYFSRKVLFTSFKNFAVVFVFFLAGYFFISIYVEDIRSVRMILELITSTSPEEYISGKGGGSFGTRLNYIEDSKILFYQNPFLGVGFGGWHAQNFYSDHKYPHNIIYELISEVGIIGLTLFLFLINKLWTTKNIFGIIGVYSLISLLFSGDFSYFRYALFPLLISYYINKNTLNV